MPKIILSSQKLYAFFLKLYPGPFKGAFAHEMNFVFAESLHDAYDRHGIRGVVLLWARTSVDLLQSLSHEHIQHRREQYMLKRNESTRSRSLAIAGLLLCLPGIALVSMLLLNIEPVFGPLASSMSAPGQPDVTGTLAALTLLVLLPLIAFVINFAPLRQTMQAGASLLTHPMNLAVAVITLTILALFIGAIIIDQYPCWIGVPNCD